MKKWTTNNGNIIYRVLSGRSNVFLITNDNINLLVDTSTKKNYKKLNKNLEEINCEKIDFLILTHSHYDHASNALKIKKKYNPKVFIHIDEAEKLRNGENPITKGTNPLINFFVKIFGKSFLNRARYDGVKANIFVEEKYDLNEFGINAYILHTPGHTTGSISIIVDEQIAIVGDAMFGVSKRSILPPFAKDLVSMIKSWKKLLNTKSGIFLPSHGNEKGKVLVEKQYKKYEKKYL